MKKISCALLAFWFFYAAVSPQARADLTQAVFKLPVKSFCVNADFDTAWEETAHVLRRMGLSVSLADRDHRVVTTEFAAADYGQLFKIAANPRLFLKGRFTLKILFAPETQAYTRIDVVLQVRQKKAVGKGERILKTRGSFEKYFAYQVNQLAVGRRYPKLYEIRLGMELIPDIQTERYAVARVERESPAGEAGFQAGDELIAIDGRPVSIRGELFEILLGGAPAQEFRFDVRRGKKDLAIKVWVVRVSGIDKQMGFSAHRYGGTASEFKISQLKADSPADQAGLHLGDVIVKAGGRPVLSWTDYYKALASAENEIELVLLRPGRGEFVKTVAIPQGAS